MTYRLLRNAMLAAALAALMIAFTGCDANLNGGAGKPTEPPEPTGTLYWGQYGDGYVSVRRANLDGTDVQDVIRVEEGSWMPAVAAHRGKVYWMDHLGAPREQKIWRANADGTGGEEEVLTLGVLSSDEFNYGIDLALHDDYVYWTQNVPTTGDSLWRAKLDGTGVQEELTFAGSATHVAFGGGKMAGRPTTGRTWTKRTFRVLRGTLRPRPRNGPARTCIRCGAVTRTARVRRRCFVPLCGGPRPRSKS